MAKYYFIILLTFCGIYGRFQECNSRNLLALPMLWSGDLDRFAISENAPWQLADSVANTSSLLFYTDTATTKIQFSFSLDFPPSAANRFELELGLKSKLGGGEAQLIMRIGESGSW